jgi:hypothetical protein
MVQRKGEILATEGTLTSASQIDVLRPPKKSRLT